MSLANNKQLVQSHFEKTSKLTEAEREARGQALLKTILQQALAKKFAKKKEEKQGSSILTGQKKSLASNNISITDQADQYTPP